MVCLYAAVRTSFSILVLVVRCVFFNFGAYKTCLTLNLRRDAIIDTPLAERVYTVVLEIKFYPKGQIISKRRYF